MQLYAMYKYVNLSLSTSNRTTAMCCIFSSYISDNIQLLYGHWRIQ